MRRSILLLAVFLYTSANAQLVDDHAITVVTPSDVVNKRAAIVSAIWGAGGFPSSELPTSVVTNIPSPLASLENFERVDLLRVNDGSAHPGRVLHYVPSRKNGQVVVVHQGHDPTFAGSDALTDSSTGGGLRRVINALLMDGYGVLAVYMPHYREAIDLGGGMTEPADAGGGHDSMFSSHNDTAALKWFLEPTIVALNHVQSLYSDYHMVGLSGGGWTTTLVAAIDTRIRMSFPVSGTIPLYLRGSSSSTGDLEQYLSGFYSIAGYPDLYILGSYGTHRKQVQILNRYDSCCFGQATWQHNLGSTAAWAPAVRQYELNVRMALYNLGPADMSFRVEIDDAAPSHLVSWNATIGTILAELNGGRRYAGASSVSNAFVRGGDTNLYHRNSAGTWSQLFPYVGVAAAVENGVHALDVFYRDPENHLRHAWVSAGSWTSAALPLPPAVTAMISDPAAVGAPGRYDVVAVGNDYKLYHWSSTGGAPVVTAVTGSQYVRGTPSMIARAGGFDVFYRGDARATYHARWNGASWTTTHLGGMMQDFPSGAVTADGTLRVFLRGMSGQLWQASLPPGGGWTLTSISAGIAGVPLIAGSPAALVQSDGTLKVYARNGSGNLLAFTLGATWSMANVSGGVTGSPTPTVSGPLVRGNGAGLFWYNGTGFVYMGGWFD